MPGLTPILTFHDAVLRHGDTFSFFLFFCGNCVVTTTRLTPGVRFPIAVHISLDLIVSTPDLSSTQPSFQRALGAPSSSMRLRILKVGHALRSTEVNSAWSHTSTSHTYSRCEA